MNKYKIEQVVPHQAPMILLDALQQYSKTGCVCELTIHTDSMFYNPLKQGVPSYVGSEYMAQAIAAFAGANALDEGSEVKIGFLLGSRKFKTFEPYFSLSSKLTIAVDELYREESGLSVFECRIIAEDDTLLASANINVFQPEDSQEFLQDIYE